MTRRSLRRWNYSDEDYVVISVQDNTQCRRTSIRRLYLADIRRALACGPSLQPDRIAIDTPVAVLSL